MKRAIGFMAAGVWGCVVLAGVCLGAEASGVAEFKSFTPERLDQKRETGFGVDQFFGTLAVMEKAGQYDKKKPVAVLKRVLTALTNNEYEDETREIIAFYFSRLGIENPSLVGQYSKLFEDSEDDAFITMAMILWYTGDKEAARELRLVYNDPHLSDFIRPAFRRIFQNKDFVRIKVETMPIERAMDIELLWAEYFVTNNIRAVERIADQVITDSTDMQKVLVSVEAGSSLAQRGGWFAAVKGVCQARCDAAQGNAKTQWQGILDRMKDAGDGTEKIAWPLDHVKLDGVNARAMACGAVWVRMYDGRMDQLAPWRTNAASIERDRKSLADSWTIAGRYELLTSIESLINRGHRSSYAEKAKKLQSLKPEQRDRYVRRQPLDDQPDWKVVADTCDQTGEKGIIAWDLGRIVMLARFGYEVQYLAADESFRLAIPVAIELQKTFDSWAQMGDNIRIGRLYWRAQKEDAQKVHTAIEKLLSEENSPWKKYAWDMALN